MTRSLATRCAAEAAGTALLVGIGTGAIVAGADVGGIPLIELAVAWAIAVAVPVLLFAGTSGAHLNPAVTLSLGTSGRFPWSEVPPYVAAQCAGALAASVAVRWSLGPAAADGATTPHGIGPVLTGLLEFAFTLLLVASVLYLTAPGPAPPRRLLLLPAAVVGLSTYAIGPLTGSSLNPARSLGPAIVSGTATDLGIYVAAALAAGGLGGVAPWLRSYLRRG